MSARFAQIPTTTVPSDTTSSKRTKPGVVVGWVILALAIVVVVAVILYFSLRPLWTYGCVDTGVCVQGAGNQTKEECEQICALADRDEQQWYCEPLKGCRYDIELSSGRPLRTFTECQEACRQNFLMEYREVVGGGDLGDGGYLGGAMGNDWPNCPAQPDRAVGFENQDKGLPIVLLDLDAAGTVALEGERAFQSRVRQANLDRYLSVQGSQVSWSANAENATLLTFDPTPFSFSERSQEPGYQPEFEVTVSSAETGQLRYLTLAAFREGCPSDLLSALPESEVLTPLSWRLGRV
jgi:hypothetical protein